MQHSSLRFRHSTFHKQQSSFRIRPSSSMECAIIFLHPIFSICPLSFRFRHPTLGIIGLLPAGQRPIEIVGSIDLTHPRSNGGRESIERLSSGVDSGDLLHSRQTRRITDRTWPRGCTAFEGGECCTTDCLL